MAGETQALPKDQSSQKLRSGCRGILNPGPASLPDPNACTWQQLQPCCLCLYQQRDQHAVSPLLLGGDCLGDALQGAFMLTQCNACCNSNTSRTAQSCFPFLSSRRCRQEPNPDKRHVHACQCRYLGPEIASWGHAFCSLCPLGLDHKTTPSHSMLRRVLTLLCMHALLPEPMQQTCAPNGM